MALAKDNRGNQKYVVRCSLVWSGKFLEWGFVGEDWRCEMIVKEDCSGEGLRPECQRHI